ncbi:thermonuclease family protein [Mycoplasmopsis cricetuli]|uniref:thermonuclease family protein n=1 Tax=Mycoplasmopsis cricetuli TaxID=171283 RepID=UPI00046EE114|nr:thermonuclease family protein [Mycoplasmopsis cricetuli]
MKKKLLFPVSITILPAVGIAVGCENKEEIQIPPENYLKINTNLEYEIENVKGNKNFVKFTYPKNKLNSSNRSEIISKFRDEFSLLKTEIKKSIETLNQNITILPGKFLIPEIIDINNYPKEINLKIKDKYFVLKNSEIQSSFLDKKFKQQTKIEDKNDKQIELDKIYTEFKTSDKFKILTSFHYNLFYKNQLVSDFNVSIEKESESKANPTMEKFKQNINLSEHKLTNLDINWESEEIKKQDNYFDAEIVKYSDGDTLTVIAKTDLPKYNVKKGELHKIRLSGIDTPEKAIQKTKAAPIEYAFAELPSKFMEDLFNLPLNETLKLKDKVRIGFITGKDTYERITADVFFGENYQYSYNLEVVSAGLTLPLDDKTEWQFKIKSPNNYYSLVYPKMFKNFNEAIEQNRGFFHYFKSPIDVAFNVYLIKPNTSWSIFWKEKFETSNNKNIKISDLVSID